jgi:LacI family transcriptional regulator
MRSSRTVKAALPGNAVDAAMAYIARYACEGLSVERLLQETQQVAGPVFVRRFKAATGMTPRAAILRRQLDEARRLLAGTELSLLCVAEHCGFRNVAALDRALRAAGNPAASALRAQARPPGDTRSAAPVRTDWARQAQPGGSLQ